MLDLGCTSFIISPEAATAVSIPVVTRPRPKKSGDVSGNNLETENLFSVHWGVSFGNHRSYNEEDHAFEVIKTSGVYDALIPVWYVEKHKARGTTMSHLHFPHCQPGCYNYGKVRSEYSITYAKRITPNKKATHNRAIVISNPTIARILATHYPKFLPLFDPKEAEKLPDNKGCEYVTGVYSLSNLYLLVNTQVRCRRSYSLLKV
jgi:hypothetical protein